MVIWRTVSREQFLSNSRARRTTSRRTTSHQRLEQTAKTNLESLLLEHLLLHLCVLARAHRKKGSLSRLYGERVLLRVINSLRLFGFGLPLNKSSAGQVHTQYHRTRLVRKECSSHFRVAGPHTQFVTNDTIHMRCTHHTH